MSDFEQTIDFTLGAIEYTNPLLIIERSGPPAAPYPQDISGDVIRLGLLLDGAGTVGTWYPPDVDVASSTAINYATGNPTWKPVYNDLTQLILNVRTLKLLIGGTVRPDAGRYLIVSRTVDDPETVPRRHGWLTVIG